MSQSPPENPQSDALEPLLDKLNPAQREAVTAEGGAVLVLAGPGSGKTRVLTHRIAYLVARGVAPYHIMAVTFTNKAASEMTERLRQLLGDDLKGTRIGTFHALCARILRAEHHATPFSADYTIFDTDDQLKVVTQVMSEQNLDTRKSPPRAILNAISNAKNEFILPTQYQAGDYFSGIVQRVYPAYQRLLLDSNAMDFDDLLVNAVLLIQGDDAVREKYQRLVQHILVDEFQDTNMVQYRLVKLFGAPQGNIFAVGDEDQSIYAFRGADYRNVQRFRQDYTDANVILLEQNYRSTQNILDVAQAVIKHNRNRTHKHLTTTKGAGERITLRECYDDHEEAQFILDTIGELRMQGHRYDDFAVMYRTNAQSRALESTCLDYGVPYTLVGGVGFYKRREVRDLLAYLRVVNNPDDRIAFARIINVPRRGIGEASLRKFQQWVAEAGITYSEALDQILQGGRTPLSSTIQQRFARFAQMWTRWRQIVDDAEIPLTALFDDIRQQTAYVEYLKDTGDTPNEVNERMENLDELRGLLAQADEQGWRLNDFLNNEALKSDVDNEQRDTPHVTLMTLHAAKGLEYPFVFITGLEEGILPHQRALEDDFTLGTNDALEEERRLLYVGITRAKERLYLSYAFRRTRFGSSDVQSPSSFLANVPPELIEGKAQTPKDDYRRQTHWDSVYTPPSTGGLERMQADFDAFRASRTPSPDALSQKHEEKPVSKPSAPPRSKNPDIRKKIIHFPGSKDAVEPHFKPDQRVTHPLFGVGRVLDSVVVGGEEEITVQFDNPRYGKKTLLNSLANLQRLDD